MVSSKMLPQLSRTLNSTVFFRNLPFGYSRFWHVEGIRQPCHTLVPALDITVQNQLSQSPPPAVSLKTVSANTLSMNVNYQSRVCDKGLLCRGFSTSACRAAKELSDKGDVVYTGPISQMIRAVKLFSLSTSAIGICLQPLLLFNNQEISPGLKFAVGGFVNFFIFVNPFIIHFIAKKYVTELRWNRATGVFTAATMTLFARRKEIQFTAEDVKIPDVPGMFTFLEAKGTPLFMDPQAFKGTEAYIHMMGYDKPLDWELPPKKDD